MVDHGLDEEDLDEYDGWDIWAFPSADRSTDWAPGL